VAGDIVFHPTLTAAWYGTLLTAINLVPLPPFDGWKVLEACASSGVDLAPIHWSLVGIMLLMGVLCCPPLF